MFPNSPNIPFWTRIFSFNTKDVISCYNMAVFAWVYYNRICFVVKRGYIKDGQAVLRQRQSQVIVYVNEDYQMVNLDIPKPLSSDIYYATWSAIYQNNKRKCNYIKLEKKLGTHSWDHQVNLSTFGVSVVDTYNVST